jgi:hypothetical protein
MTCTASVGYIEANRERCDFGETPEASEGTIAHEWAAACLDNKAITNWHDVPQLEMRQNVRAYVEYVEDMAGDAELHVEQSVPLFYRTTDHGTVDCWFVVEDTLYIIDLKYGAGVEVEAVDNTQLLIYAASVMRMLPDKPERVVMTIFQPRFERQVKQWSTVRPYVIARARRIAGEVLDIEMGYEEFKPSADACRFCPARGFCPHRASSVTEIMPAGPLALPAPADMSDEQLALFVLKKGDFSKWLKDVEDYITRRMVNEGREVPGLKVVKGRDGNRRWVDEAGAEKFLAHKIGPSRWERKLISPTQAEKILKDAGMKHTRTLNRFESLVGRNDGRPVVVPEEDKRESIATLECKFQVKN